MGLPTVGGMSAGFFKMVFRFAGDSSWDTTLGFFSLANIAMWSTVRHAHTRA